MMDNDRKDYLLGLDLSKVEPNGEYYYFGKSSDSTLLYEKRCLTDEDIVFLRRYYRDRDLFPERIIERKEVHYKLAVDINKYNRKCHYENVPQLDGEKVIIGGVVVNMKRVENLDEIYGLGR